MFNKHLPIKNNSRENFPASRLDEDFWMLDTDAPAFNPHCEIEETDRNFFLRFEVPGVREEDLDVEMKGQVLKISGERKKRIEEKGRAVHYSEMAFGNFERSFTLPDIVDLGSVEAEYDQGLLTVTAPKRESVTPRKIAISAHH